VSLVRRQRPPPVNTRIPRRTAVGQVLSRSSRVNNHYAGYAPETVRQLAALTDATAPA